MMSESVPARYRLRVKQRRQVVQYADNITVKWSTLIQTLVAHRVARTLAAAQNSHHYPTDALGQEDDDTETQLANRQRGVLR